MPRWRPKFLVKHSCVRGTVRARAENLPSLYRGATRGRYQWPRAKTLATRSGWRSDSGPGNVEVGAQAIRFREIRKLSGGGLKMISRKAAIAFAGTVVLALACTSAVFAQGRSGDRDDHDGQARAPDQHRRHARAWTISIARTASAPSTAASPIARISPNSAEHARQLPGYIHVQAFGLVPWLDGARYRRFAAHRRRLLRRCL